MFTIEKSKEILAKKVKKFPEMCIVLGSGWNSVMADVKEEITLSYGELFGVEASVPGHEGKLIIGTLENKRVALMAGRFHTYEGYTTEEVTRPIQVFAAAGMKKLVLTAATGALNEKYTVGDFVIVSDMLTGFCPSPLTGPKFTDLSQAFDLEMRRAALQICAAENLRFHEGIYCYTRGPHFETPADKMFYHHLGADVIGMSTVPETIMARYLGVKVLGLAYVTNLAFVVHHHEDVLQAAQEGSKQMVKLLKGVAAQS
jgi:purine-nucleoside phosphorylase